MRQINLRNVQDAETITKQYMLSVSTESMLAEAGNSKLKDVFGMPLLVTYLFIFSFIGFFFSHVCKFFLVVFPLSLFHTRL